MKNQYTKAFYGNDISVRIRQGQIVLGELFKFYKPNSMIDFGCGLGHWLKSAKDNLGVLEIKGVDGNFVDKKHILIDDNEFLRHDLEQPFNAKKKYDLAISIETAEHISPLNSDNIVKALTDSANIILFTAAPPYQEGLHHVNMNTPAYWAKKFKKFGYVCYDFLRKELWNNPEVNCIYPQNALVFVKGNGKEKEMFSKLKLEIVTEPLLIYHPRFMQIKMKEKYNPNLNKNPGIKTTKKVIYTALIGKYDKVRPIKKITGWDYVMFTDQPINDSDLDYGWDIRQADMKVGKNNHFVNRWYKMHPHIVFKNYDESIYLDSNIDIINYDYIDAKIEYLRQNKITISIPQHLHRDCLYDEGFAILDLEKDTKENIKTTLEFLVKENYPLHNGLYDNSFIYRQHNNKILTEAMEAWWKCINTLSVRDQMSLAYLLWKLNIKCDHFFGDNAWGRDRDDIQYNNHL